MQFWNEGKLQETLDKYLKPGENPENIAQRALNPHVQCSHVWQYCVHNGLGSYGSSHACMQVSLYASFGHFVCARGCDVERYTDCWGNLASRILENRRDGILQMKAA